MMDITKEKKEFPFGYLLFAVLDEDDKIEKQALNGNTPNEKIGLTELGTNKWLSLIKKSGVINVTN